VIAIDTHILVCAHREDSPCHAAAANCLASCAEGQLPRGPALALPARILRHLFAISTHARTHARIHNPPTPAAGALDQIDAWLESPSLVLLAESDRHWSALRTLLTQSRAVGPAVHDAHIAALCLQHGVQKLWSADRDFSRSRAESAQPFGHRLSEGLEALQSASSLAVARTFCRHRGSRVAKDTHTAARAVLSKTRPAAPMASCQFALGLADQQGRVAITRTLGRVFLPGAVRMNFRWKRRISRPLACRINCDKLATRHRKGQKF